jgi:hypothetical protein
MIAARDAATARVGRKRGIGIAKRKGTACMSAE